MKKAILFTLIVFCAFSCIKKKALKYDPELVGTWVSNEDSVYTWLIITPDGIGDYSTDGNSETSSKGEVKYSVFERKMWVGSRRFKVTVWRSGKLDGVGQLKTKEKGTFKDTTYVVDEKMILKSLALGSRRTITLYRIKK
jgi:hypothetical protein